MLPPQPVRQYQELPETRQDFISLIVYYEALVQEWEVWAQTVKRLVLFQPSDVKD